MPAMRRPGSCATRLVGAAAVRGPGRRKIRRGSVPGAASSAAIAGRDVRPVLAAKPGPAGGRGEHLIAGLADPPPGSVTSSAASPPVGPARAAGLIGQLGRLLPDGGANHPQAVLERARRPGRSMGSLARALEGFFVERGLALPTDQAERLAAGRRQRRIDAVPAAAPGGASVRRRMLQARQRARRPAPGPAATTPSSTACLSSGTWPSSWRPSAASATGRSSTCMTSRRSSQPGPKTGTSRLVLRQFFRFARTRRIVLVDPTRGLTRPQPEASPARPPLAQQRDLFRRWTTDRHSPPRGSARYPGAAARRVQRRMCGCSAPTSTRPPNRPARSATAPMPLDPASWRPCSAAWTIAQLGHREPHIVVTRRRRPSSRPRPTISHLLDPAGVPPNVRCTRLAALVNTMDPKLVATAFGMNTEGVIFYLADQVDDARLPGAASNP